MNPIEQFQAERISRIERFGKSESLQIQSRDWLERSMAEGYVYNFEWMGRPIIQYPQEIVAIQELVWSVRPDLIIETGIAHGGSLVLSASLLALLDLCDAHLAGTMYDPSKPKRKVVGVDIDIREHNHTAITSHPMANRIEMIQGSSISTDTIAKVKSAVVGYERVLVCLDSMHTHDHVLAELEAYAPLVSVGSYCVVFDTFVEDMPPGFFKDRPWNVRNNPKTAVWEYLKSNQEFEIDKMIENKLLITVAPDGYLKKVR
ncbi:MAG: cephalosporin hydroxylase family protein [Magnetococcales bacterium]|nr:cephalosporin hydroxylase family protein [Magnetococcales bacterium]